MSQKHWDNLLRDLLGDDHPCLVCAVQVMCRKSFATNKGGGCPELKESIKEALRRKNFGIEENEN